MPGFGAIYQYDQVNDEDNTLIFFLDNTATVSGIQGTLVCNVDGKRAREERGGKRERGREAETFDLLMGLFFLPRFLVHNALEILSLNRPDFIVSYHIIRSLS